MDYWQKHSDGTFQFRFRNLWNQPFSDVEYIKELELRNKKLEDEGAKEVIRHLLHSCDTVVRELKDILNQLTTPQEHKDFGLGDSPNTWSHSSCNYFDKPNPLFTNPSELKK